MKIRKSDRFFFCWKFANLIDFFVENSQIWSTFLVENSQIFFSKIWRTEATIFDDQVSTDRRKTKNMLNTEEHARSRQPSGICGRREVGGLLLLHVVIYGIQVWTWTLHDHRVGGRASGRRFFDARPPHFSLPPKALSDGDSPTPPPPAPACHSEPAWVMSWPTSVGCGLICPGQLEAHILWVRRYGTGLWSPRQNLAPPNPGDNTQSAVTSSAERIRSSRDFPATSIMPSRFHCCDHNLPAIVINYFTKKLDEKLEGTGLDILRQLGRNFGAVNTHQAWSQEQHIKSLAPTPCAKFLVGVRKMWREKEGWKGGLRYFTTNLDEIPEGMEARYILRLGLLILQQISRKYQKGWGSDTFYPWTRAYQKTDFGRGHFGKFSDSNSSARLWSYISY